ncbi:MAG TPA: dephospho-CoA kinase [Chromatiales bacterium]|nr:dephospho-CoA kinase [Chromatiales bacterium]
MLVVGLTGGIGSGKSTVAELFAEKNIPIVDADEISHALTQPDGRAYEKLKSWLGNQFFDHQGQLKRSKLRELVFSKPEVLDKLEQLLHPLVEDAIKQRLEELSQQAHDYVIVVIPLLIETKMYSLVDRVLVIDCPEPLQIKRVTARDNSSVETIKKILAQQINSEERLKHADDIIVNTGTLNELKPQIEKLDKFYRQQA